MVSDAPRNAYEIWISALEKNELIEIPLHFGAIHRENVPSAERPLYLLMLGEEEPRATWSIQGSSLYTWYLQPKLLRW